MYEVLAKWFHGKTIQKVDGSSANCWVFHFTDGSSAFVDTVHKGHNIYGPFLDEQTSEELTARNAECHKHQQPEALIDALVDSLN